MHADPKCISPEQAGRDLIWAITSNSLIDDKSILPEALSESDVDANELAAFVNDRFAVPVGRYFELLILFHLQHCLKVEMIAHGQQIQVDGRTVGELDFVFRSPTDPTCVYHLETAVKFYLHESGDHHSGSHFIGPNSADNFESKLARLRSHQLPLSKQHAPEVTHRHPFVKGIIFYRSDEPLPALRPAGMAANHETGIWLRSNELHSLATFAKTSHSEIRFLLRAKPLWLSNAVLPCGHHDLLTFAEVHAALQSHFANAGKPRMLSVMQKDDGHFVEQHRAIVVEEDWPYTTSPK